MRKINFKILTLLTLLTVVFSLCLSATAQVTITDDNNFNDTYFSSNYYGEGERLLSGNRVDYYTWYKVYPEMWDEVVKLASQNDGVAILMGYQSNTLGNKKVQYVTSNKVTNRVNSQAYVDFINFTPGYKLMWYGKYAASVGSSGSTLYTNLKIQSVFGRRTYSNLLFTNQDRNENSNFFVTRNVLPSYYLHASTETAANGTTSTSFYLEGVNADGKKGYVNISSNTLFNKMVYGSDKQAFTISLAAGKDDQYVIYGDVETSSDIYEAYYSNGKIVKSDEHTSNLVETLAVMTGDGDASGSLISMNYCDFDTSHSAVTTLSTSLRAHYDESVLYNMDKNRIDADKKPNSMYTLRTADSYCTTFYLWVGVKGISTSALLSRGESTVLHGDYVAGSGRYIDSGYTSAGSIQGVTASTTTVSSDVTVKAPTTQGDMDDSVYSIAKGSVVYVPVNRKITVQKGAALIVSSGATLILHGTIENYGSLIVQPGGQIITMQQEDNMRSAIYNINGGSTIIRDGGIVAVRRFVAGVKRGSYYLGDQETDEEFYGVLESAEAESTVVVNGFLSAFIELALLDGTEVEINGGKIVYGDLQDSIYPYITALDAHDIIDEDFTSKIIIGTRTNTLNGDERHLTARCYVSKAVYTLENGGEIITAKN